LRLDFRGLRDYKIRRRFEFLSALVRTATGRNLSQSESGEDRCKGIFIDRKPIRFETFMVLTHLGGKNLIEKCKNIRH